MWLTEDNHEVLLAGAAWVTTPEVKGSDVKSNDAVMGTCVNLYAAVFTTVREKQGKDNQQQKHNESSIHVCSKQTKA